MICFMICELDGRPLRDGLCDKAEAREIAQKMALERGRSLRIYRYRFDTGLSGFREIIFDDDGEDVAPSASPIDPFALCRASA